MKSGKDIFYLIPSFCSLAFTLFLWSSLFNFLYEQNYKLLCNYGHIWETFIKFCNCVFLHFSFKDLIFIKVLLEVTLILRNLNT